MQIRCGYIWKQLRASIADSQRTISREPWIPIQKYPKSFRVPGAIPRQARGPVPRSSAPTGRLAFPATSAKTALPRLSAYNLPDSMSGSMSDARRYTMRDWVCPKRAFSGMIPPASNKEEHPSLQYERFHYPDPRIQVKMEALWLKSRGLDHAQIANLTGVSTRTIQRYLNEYQQGGLERLKQDRYVGPTSELALKQANAERVRSKFFAAVPRDTASGRRHQGRRVVSDCVVFHLGLGCTQCGSG